MAVQYEHGAQSISLLAGADLSESTGHLVKLAGETVVPVAVDTDPAVGVLTNDPKEGDAASVVFSGAVKVVAGGVINAGAGFTIDATGRAVAATGTKIIYGRAIDAADADGDVILAIVDTATAVSAGTGA